MTNFATNARILYKFISQLLFLKKYFIKKRQTQTYFLFKVIKKGLTDMFTCVTMSLINFKRINQRQIIQMMNLSVVVVVVLSLLLVINKEAFAAGIL